MKIPDSILIGNANIFTLGNNSRNIPDGALYVEDGIIKKIGLTRELMLEFPDCKFFDMKGKIILPGNIISHTHLYSSFARGMALKDDAPENFVQILERLWWRLDKVLTDEDNYYSALAYLIQCIKYGTTSIIDHHASPGSILGSLDLIADAVEKAGIRASLCYEVTDRNGKDEAVKGIKENIRFAIKCVNNSSSLVKPAFGIHASFTVSDETLGRCIDEAKDNALPIHMHVEEDLADRKDSIEKYGVPVLKRLQNAGATSVPVIAAHCVHVSKDELDILKDNNITVVHNPESNMNNAVGVAPVLEMLDSGITVGLGTDGMTADFYQELKVLPLLHKISRRDPRACSFEQIYKMAYINNGKAAGIFWKDAQIGTIEEGSYADIIALDYFPPTPVSADNILGHILFGINSSMVNTTIVNGKVLMNDKQLLHIDEEKVMVKCRELAAKVWQRL